MSDLFSAQRPRDGLESVVEQAGNGQIAAALPDN